MVLMYKIGTLSMYSDWEHKTDDEKFALEDFHQAPSMHLFFVSLKQKQ